MDAATLILVPLIAGYYFAATWNRTKYRLHRAQGQRFYFKVALYGLTLLFVSALLVHLYNASCLPKPTFVLPLYERFGIEDGLQKNYTDSVIITLLLGFLLGHLLNLQRDSNEKYFEEAIKDRDLERIIWDSMQEDFPLLISMENNKVYAGYVMQAIDPSTDSTHLRIQPILSGYRNEHGKVDFTTNYAQIYSTIYDDTPTLGHLDLEHFQIVLPISLAQSISFFDSEAYTVFQEISATKGATP